MNIVRYLSLLLSRVLVAKTAGTVQPKPTIRGTNAFPGRPINLMNLSIKKAARAIYPESSRIESIKNIIKIIGIKVVMVCIPVPIPFAKIIINSNSLPNSLDTSDGFYRRWLIVNFPNEFPEGRDIIATIQKEKIIN